METIREVPFASALGYTEIDDFRRDLKAGEIPGPCSYLGPNKKRPIWLRSDVERWLGIQSKSAETDGIMDMISKVA